METRYQSEEAVPVQGFHTNRHRSNAQIFATHLATKQWQEAGQPQALNSIPIYQNPPTISKVTMSIEKLKLIVKQSKAAKRIG